MNSTRLRKYDTGRSRKSRHLDKASKLLLECGVNEYLSGLEPDVDGDAGAAVMTVPASKTRTRNGNGKTPQMLLWDQPVAVAAFPEPEAPAAPQPARGPSEQSEPERIVHRTRSLRDPEGADHEPFSLLGFLKGCGIGLATAAALLAIYLLIH